MPDCKCDAQYSGNDEAEYRARGCPSCICGIIDQRYLMHHPESDCIFEVFTADDRLKSISEDGCDDVTGFTVYEKMFLMEEK